MLQKMLYKEFFSQGDLEKALGRNPMEMMDRERASIPDLQIGFIDHIVLPAFRYSQQADRPLSRRYRPTVCHVVWL